MRSSTLLVAALAAMAVGAMAESYLFLDSPDYGLRLSAPITNVFAGKGVIALAGSFPQSGAGTTLDVVASFFGVEWPDSSDKSYHVAEPRFTGSITKSTLKDWGCTTTLGSTDGDGDFTLTAAFNVTCPMTNSKWGYGVYARSVYTWPWGYSDAFCVNVLPTQVPTGGNTYSSVSWEFKGPTGADGSEYAKGYTVARMMSANMLMATFAGLPLNFGHAFTLKSPSPMPVLKDLQALTSGTPAGSGGSEWSGSYGVNKNGYYDWYSYPAFMYMWAGVYLSPDPCLAVNGVLKPNLAWYNDWYAWLGSLMGDGTNMWTGCFEDGYWGCW